MDLSPEEQEKEMLAEMIRSMPKQVVQYFTEVPTQYRLIYLLAFLYAHQDHKVIVFVSNCELANFI
jgi:superfamily II DNA/RNA helicase